jgi:hypothetical protein
MNSQILLTVKQVRLNKQNEMQVLIHFQVRSHPALVLPATGGRYSLGLVVPFREHHRLILAL